MESRLVEAQTDHKPNIYSEKCSIVQTSQFQTEIESIEVWSCMCYQFNMRIVKVLRWSCRPGVHLMTLKQIELLSFAVISVFQAVKSSQNHVFLNFILSVCTRRNKGHYFKRKFTSKKQTASQFIGDANP